MKTEMQIMERLRDVIVRSLPGHFTADGGNADLIPLDEKCVSIDFPDTDSMRRDTCVFIQPDYENFEQMSLSCDQAVLNLTVIILTKGARSDVLIRRVFGYFTAFCSLIHSDRGLEGFVDHTEVTDMDYYPAVTASKTMTAIEATVRIMWDRTF